MELELCDKEYLSAGSYADYLLGRLKGGAVWRTVNKVYRRVRRYTLISSIVRAIVLLVGLLEKSAILLLLTTGALFLLPAVIIFALILALAGILTCLHMHRAVSAWIGGAERVTVYLTSDAFYSRRGEKQGREVPEDTGARWRRMLVGRRRYLPERGRRPSNSTAEARARNVQAVVAARPLFARMAMAEAAEYTHPVVVVCSDSFTAARWGGLNLLTVKCAYFYFLRRFYLKGKTVAYTVIS